MEHNPRDDQGRYSEADLHDPWADIQRQGSILAWDHNFVCLWCRHNCRSQVIDRSLSSLISWFRKSSIGFLNNSNLHAIISTSLTINLQWVKKVYFAVLEEIYNNVVPHWSAFLISCNHSTSRLISFTKNDSNLRSILSVFGPWFRSHFHPENRPYLVLAPRVIQRWRYLLVLVLVGKSHVVFPQKHAIACVFKTVQCTMCTPRPYGTKYLLGLNCACIWPGFLNMKTGNGFISLKK